MDSDIIEYKCKTDITLDSDIYSIYTITFSHYRTGLVCRVSNTLGKGPFALGKPHSVKKVTAKAPLPSVFFRALGKVFAECQKALGKLFETRLEKQRLKIAKHFIFTR